MEKQHSDVLAELRQKIIDDVDVYNGILTPLTTEYVLRNEDIEKIKSGKTKKSRAEILLDILPGCGPYAFDVFNRALKNQYSWLSFDIERILRSRSIDMSNQMGRVSPGSPNLPPQPEMTVTREAKMTQLKSALVKLKPGGYLALHGMKGFGKSCLTANTLKDTSLVRTAFNNKVYWIKFGYERSLENEILIQLNFLYHQVRNSETMHSILNSEPLKEHLVHYLRNHFGKDNQRNALLILDDVWNKKIIDVFDFHCKTLVITTDIDFLDGRQRDIIEMKEGFSEAESLGLFATVLETTVDKLPPEAKKIHDECNGMPILIAMFAAQFEEFKHDMNISQRRWKYYLDSLRNKDSTNKVIGKFFMKQEAIFDMCIERLSPDAKTKYEALAIFSQDVNIMPQTLEILWDEEPYSVDDHMLDLCHKSLAAKHWNVDLKSYVYGVHDLLLCHLRRKMDPEKLKDLHRSFIEKYRNYCKNDFSKLPDDNYSFSYIGHHLEQSGLYKEFPALYLNFDFIREKIYHTGLSDLLIDLKKYRHLIIGDDMDAGEKNVDDLELFLENHAAVIAEHRRRKCLDLIQIAINHATSGYVRQKATQLALANPSKLYVTHDHSSLMHHGTVTSGEVSTEGSTARFTDDENQILIGNHSGEVILWNCETQTQAIFSGHSKNSIIKKIILATSGNFFVTLCSESQVKLFVLREVLDNDNYPTPHVQSPREKQPYWSEIFSDRASKDNSQATFSIPEKTIIDIALSSDDRRIAVCTECGIIKVWTLEGETLYTTKAELAHLERIAFNNEGTMFHIVNRDGVLKFYAEQSDGSVSFSYVATYNLKLQQRKVIQFQAVPQNEFSLIVVTEVSAIYVKWTNVRDPKYPKLVSQIHSFSKQERAAVENPEVRFTCASLTYDGRYLVTGDSEGLINVWDIDVGMQPIATFKGRTISLDTYWLEEGYHLICGFGNRVIHRCTLASEELPRSVRKPLFDAVMKPWGEVDIVAKETAENTIVLCHGDKTLARTDSVEGDIIRLSLNCQGNKIVYATSKGVISVFDKETERSIQVAKIANAWSIVTFVNIDGTTFVAYGDGENLKVWYEKITIYVENTGHVISIHIIGKKNVVTVAREGIITLWSVNKMTNWASISTIKYSAKDDSLRYSCLSPNERSLTVLTAQGKMIIYDILKDVSLESSQIDIDVLVEYDYNQRLSRCAYSHDENFLAIGLETGDISIFDIPGQCEVFRLEFHCNEVRQLQWSPTSVGCPILLSVNCDELAWWNISLLLNQKKQNRRSRMGMSRSISSSIGFSPRSSLRLAISRSVESEISSVGTSEFQALTLQTRNGNANETGNSDNGVIETPAESYWKNKTAKQMNRSALLTVVPLPPSCNSKICVSDDFTKCLSVDIHGSVSNFKLFNYK